MYRQLAGNLITVCRCAIKMANFSASLQQSLLTAQFINNVISPLAPRKALAKTACAKKRRLDHLAQRLLTLKKNHHFLHSCPSHRWLEVKVRSFSPLITASAAFVMTPWWLPVWVTFFQYHIRFSTLAGSKCSHLSVYPKISENYTVPRPPQIIIWLYAIFSILSLLCTIFKLLLIPQSLFRRNWRANIVRDKVA